MSRSLTIYADGASRGNPGPAAIGVVVFDDYGKPVKTVSQRLGITTNNNAEYRALIAGLESALELGADHVDIKMDSELVVRQIQGRYRVKDRNLAGLFEEVKGLLNRVGSFSIDYVPRRENSLADRLANQALDGDSR